MEYVDKGFEYLHGKYSSAQYPEEREDLNVTESTSSENAVKSIREWKANPDGSIPCPPKYLGGCGSGILELRSTFSDDRVADLVKNAEVLVQTYNIVDTPTVSEQTCSCFTSEGMINFNNDTLKKAASRDNAYDNYLYCANALDLKNKDLKHFQYHWIKGEPVIVRNVLETTSGLSWEPMVMWRAFRQIINTRDSKLDVTAIDCLPWAEVSFSMLLNTIK